MANMIQLGRLYCDLTTAVGPAVVEQTLVRVGVAEGTVYSVAHPVPEGCDRPTGQVMFYFFGGGCFSFGLEDASCFGIYPFS